MKKERPKWNTIDWEKIQLRIRRIQVKIYNHSLTGNKNQLTKLQKILLNLFEAKLLFVRKVTQDSRGKKIAGIDGVKWLLVSTRRSPR